LFCGKVERALKQSVSETHVSKDRATQFQKIQQSVAPYRERLETCKEWKIPAAATAIPSQIQDNITLDMEAKLTLATEFDFACRRIKNLIAKKERGNSLSFYVTQPV
jgi:hypothetical protein